MQTQDENKRFDVDRVKAEDAKLSSDEWRVRIAKLINSAAADVDITALGIDGEQNQDAWYEHIDALCRRLAVHVGSCDGCGVTPLYTIRSRHGKFMKFTKRGISHFADCPQAERFKQRKMFCSNVTQSPTT